MIRRDVLAHLAFPWALAIALTGSGCDDAAPIADGRPDALPRAPDVTVNPAEDSGTRIVLDSGADDAADPIAIDAGFDDAGNPIAIDGGDAIDGGFDDAGNPIAIDGGGATADSGSARDGSTAAPDGSLRDGGAPSTDGGASASDGGASAGDGGAASTDGGPLGQPLSQFCSGMGAVVDVGAGGQCSGTVAQQTFRFAVCTCDSMGLQSNVEIDAFDSRLGPYGAPTPNGPNVLEDGHVGVNGALSVGGMMNVLGSVFVSGGGFSVGQRSLVSVNVYTSGDAVQSNSSTDVGRNMFVDGDVIGRYDIGQNLYVPQNASIDPATLANVGGAVVRGPIPAITPCPCGPSEILDVQSFVDFGQAVNDNAVTGVITSTTWANGLGPDVFALPCGRYYLTRVIHPRGITIRAQGRTVLYVDGDVTLGGGLRLELDPGAEIDLFIAGSLALQAASRLGDEDQPSAVRTYVGGAAPIVLNASSVFGGNLYAPRADVAFNASADLYGALFARSVFFAGSADIHFDSAIRSAGQACAPDGGVADGGAGTGDGGARADGGGATADAGTRTDGGNGGDGGRPDATADAGTRADAAVTDGGAIRDAGAPDSGATPCTQCFECGNQQACLPTGGGGGVCGACQSDLDCCPTSICTFGSCIPSF